MSLANEVSTLTTAVNNIKSAVETAKPTLDSRATSGVGHANTAKGHQDTAKGYQDEAEQFKETTYDALRSIDSIYTQNLSAINESKSVTATDVFVYDTSKDSDGGAWRKKTTKTSWYNEQLGTTTRGSRKEFPVVAVIVAESDKVTIYDGDDPDLPMWMVFNGAYNQALYGGGASYPFSSVVMKNGMLVTGCQAGTNATAGGLSIASFITDSALTSRGAQYGKFKGTLAERNEAKSHLGSAVYEIADNSVNNVAITVLPNAPIDPDTNLPVPTIAVATDGGVSVIKDDGSVNSFWENHGGITKVMEATWHGADIVWFTGYGTSTSVYKYVVSHYTSSGARPVSERLYQSSSNSTVPHISSGLDATYINSSVATGVRKAALGTHNDGLTLLDENPTNPSEGSVAYITSGYNTGWMVGDIKLATLSDTDDADVTGSELVTNGTFDSDVSGWGDWDNLTRPSLASQAGGKGLLDASGGTCDARQEITVVAGKTYVVSATILNDSGASGRLYMSDGANYNYAFGSFQGTGTETTYTKTIKPSQTTLRLYAYNSGTATAYFDNVSVRLAEPDRSVNANGLNIVGNVTKDAVATGAELVGYGGFGGSDYLEQPYNADFNFGTGDYCVMAWVKPSNDATQYFLDRQDGANNATGRFNFGIGSNKTTIFHRTDSTLLNFNYISVTGKWAHYTLLRKNGVVYVYVDGQMIGSASNTVDYSSSFDTRFFNIGSGLSGQHPDRAALLRISATAPTPEQIAKIYRDEKPLFQENAKCTLAYTSSAVHALAYDEDTGLLHAGTPSAVSTFKGLQRTKTEASAVSTAISASNDLVVWE